MPEFTPRLGIKKPAANENVSRASFNENWDIIDTNAETVAGAQSKADAIKDWAKGYGLGSTAKDLAAVDLNSLPAEIGFYTVSSTSLNTPVSGYSYWLIQMPDAGGSTYQLAFMNSLNNRMFMRRKAVSLSAWDSWKEIGTDQVDWVTLSLQNGAVATTGRVPRYTKVGKLVTVEGQINNIAAGTTIATLPEGYRPPSNRLFKVAHNSGNTNDGASIVVNTTGAIVVQATYNTSAEISLMGLTYYVD